MSIYSPPVACCTPFWTYSPVSSVNLRTFLGMTATTDVEDFVTALGVTIRRVEADGRCATYDPFNRIAYVCRAYCKDEQHLMELLLNRIA